MQNIREMLSRAHLFIIGIPENLILDKINQMTPRMVTRANQPEEALEKIKHTMKIGQPIHLVLYIHKDDSDDSNNSNDPERPRVIIPKILSRYRKYPFLEKIPFLYFLNNPQEINVFHDFAQSYDGVANANNSYSVIEKSLETLMQHAYPHGIGRVSSSLINNENMLCYLPDKIDLPCIEEIISILQDPNLTPGLHFSLNFMQTTEFKHNCVRALSRVIQNEKRQGSTFVSVGLSRPVLAQIQKEGLTKIFNIRPSEKVSKDINESVTKTPPPAKNNNAFLRIDVRLANPMLLALQKVLNENKISGIKYGKPALRQGMTEKNKDIMASLRFSTKDTRAYFIILMNQREYFKMLSTIIGEPQTEYTGIQQVTFRQILGDISNLAGPDLAEIDLNILEWQSKFILGSDTIYKALEKLPSVTIPFFSPSGNGEIVFTSSII